jgi:spoIIIJ-associated protein
MSELNLSEQSDRAKVHLEKMLQLIGVQASVAEQTIDETTICYRIDCKESDAKILIGRKGTTLEALQFLLRQMCKGPQGGEDEHFIVDVCDYRERRKEAIVDRAKRGAVAVLNGEYEEFSLPPMSAFERRIVHNYLHEHFPDLQSESFGQGEDRHIVLRYGGVSESEGAQQ